MKRLSLTQLLIINTILYTTEFNVGQKLVGKTIRDWEKEFKFELDSLGHFPAEINETEMEKVLKTVREDEIYSKIEILDVDNSKSGYNDGSEPIVNVTLKYEDMIYIAFKGTAGGVEWRDNAYASYPEYAFTEAQREALEYFDKMYEKYVNCNIKKVYVTGHSKGGNKAQFIMVMRGSTEHTKLKKCFSFCGQGFNKTFITTYSKEIEENKDKIYNISADNDYVNVILNQVAGKIKFVKSITNIGDIAKKRAIIRHRFGAWHSPYVMLKEKNGVLVINRKTEQSRLMRTLQLFLAYIYENMTEEDLKYFYHAMSSIMIEKEKEEFVPEEYRKAPNGFYRRFITHIYNFQKEEENLSFVQILGLLRPMLTEMGAVMIKTRVGLDNIVTITNEEDNQMENISIIEYSKKEKEQNNNDDKEKDKEKNENSKNNIEIITSMINPKEWFEDITKRAKILREKYFNGKENTKEREEKENKKDKK